MTPTGSWPAALDEFAEGLRRLRAAVESGSTEPGWRFEFPATLGGLPGGLADRANALMQEARALEGSLEGSLAQLARRRRVTDRFAPGSESPLPHFVDQRG